MCRKGQPPEVPLWVCRESKLVTWAPAVNIKRAVLLVNVRATCVMIAHTGSLRAMASWMPPWLIQRGAFRLLIPYAENVVPAVVSADDCVGMLPVVGDSSPPSPKSPFPFCHQYQWFSWFCCWWKCTIVVVDSSIVVDNNDNIGKQNINTVKIKATQTSRGFQLAASRCNCSFLRQGVKIASHAAGTRCAYLETATSLCIWWTRLMAYKIKVGKNERSLSLE